MRHNSRPVSLPGRPPGPGVTDPMSRIRSALALVALSLSAVASQAQTTPAISTIVAFSLSNPVGNLVKGADGALYGVASSGHFDHGRRHLPCHGRRLRDPYPVSAETGRCACRRRGGLVQASDGLLYGTTKFGTSSQINGTGSIFRIAVDGTGFAIIHRFACPPAPTRSSVRSTPTGPTRKRNSSKARMATFTAPRARAVRTAPARSSRFRATAPISSCCTVLPRSLPPPTRASR